MPRYSPPPPPPGSSPEVHKRYDEMKAQLRAYHAKQDEIAIGMLYGLGLISALAVIAGLVWLAVYPENERAKNERSQHAAFMRECVPTEREDRCEELWRWTKRSDRP